VNTLTILIDAMPPSLSDSIWQISPYSGERSNYGIEMIDAPGNSQNEHEFERFPKAQSEPVKARSRFKIFAVMTALFVSIVSYFICQT
jgi:hypothetical protein